MLFGIDAASYQGAVVWSEIAKTCGFGFEKVTQGTGYVNPFWTPAAGQLNALAKTGKFVPGAYLFLEPGNAAAQVDFFVGHAFGVINPDEWLIAVDAEPSAAGNPTQADLNEATARLREHFPKHQLIGYCPEWYWGQQPLVQFDTLWSSKYVTVTGDPAEIYPQVPSSYWNDYGGRPIALLQFTSSASVSGVAGSVDVSAFRGSIADLQLLTGAAVTPTPVPTPTPTPVPTPGGSEMYVFDKPKGQQVVLPTVAGQVMIGLYAAQEAGAVPAAVELVCGPSEQRVTATPSWNHPSIIALPKGTTAVAINRTDTGDTPVTVILG